MYKMDDKQLVTPCFLIRKNKIDNLVEDMYTALRKYWKCGIIGYSFKTNNLPWIIEYMKENGMYAEVVSSDEFNLAKELNFSYSNIIFNGPVKGKEEFMEALQMPTIINLDSKRELRWLEECRDVKATIGLRVNFDLEKLCPSETQCGMEDGRFGFSYESGEFKEAIEKLTSLKIPLKGIHLHCSSKTRSLNIYKAIANMANEIVKKYDLTLEYVDVGGGFFGGVEGKPSFDNYFAAINDVFQQEPRLQSTNLIIEPGMALIGATVDYVATVTDIKETIHNKFVVTDGSRIHIDPLMRKTGYTYKFIYNNDLENKIDKIQTLCGFTCMENDRFFKIENQQSLKEGDRIMFQKVGAYTMGLSPLFIQFFPNVYLEDNDKHYLVRKKWTAKSFLNE